MALSAEREFRGRPDGELIRLVRYYDHMAAVTTSADRGHRYRRRSLKLRDELQRRAALRPSPSA